MTDAGPPSTSVAASQPWRGTVPETDVRLDRITKRFDEVVAVDDLSLDIERGTFFSLLGPSGCGKTTSLRMIGGFEEPTAGSIWLGGKDVTTQPAYRRNVNTVFQSYALFPHLSVFENVAFGLRRRKVGGREVDQRVAEMLMLVDLPGFEKRRPGQLSGGQQQRVALARALVNRPQVLLLDEPLGALDLKLRKQMQLELKRIQNEVGITFLYVTHDQEEAMTMSERIAVMRHGKIEQIGAPQDVYEKPATEFVAGFLGASNLLDGEIVERGPDMAVIKIPGGESLRVPAQSVDGDRSVRVGVRPEKIRIQASAEPPPSDWNSVAGTLLVSTFVGVHRQYSVEGPAGSTITVYAQNLGGETLPAVGDAVRLTWRPEHTFVVKPSAPLADWEEEA